jgi:hypothetical protein
MDTRIGTYKYPILNNGAGYVSTAYPMRIRIQSPVGCKVSLVHVAPAYAVFGEGSDHFRSYVRSLSLHFCKSLFLGLNR